MIVIRPPYFSKRDTGPAKKSRAALQATRLSCFKTRGFPAPPRDGCGLCLQAQPSESDVTGLKNKKSRTMPGSERLRPFCGGRHLARVAPSPRQCSTALKQARFPGSPGPDRLPTRCRAVAHVVRAFSAGSQLRGSSGFSPLSLLLFLSCRNAPYPNPRGSVLDKIANR